MNELQQRLIQFKHKLNMHYMERNSYNLNEEYIRYLEVNIEKIQILMKDELLIERKVA